MLFLFCVTFSVSAETVKIALSYEGNPPYSFGADENKGIYIDIFTHIFKLTPYSIEFVYLSPARIRSSFLKGEIDVECCPIPEWRKKENSISAYSNVIFDSKDVLVFAKGQRKYLESLQGSSVATVHGYGYWQDELFTRLDVESELRLLKIVAHQRVLVGIVDKMIATYLTRKHKLNIDIGQIHEQVARPLRLHSSKAYMLPIINNAIDKVKNSNTINGIFRKYE